MAITTWTYGLALQSLVEGLVNYPTATVKCLLTDSTYTVGQDTHRYLSDLTGELAAGAGYTTGGVTLTTKTVTYDTATNTLKLDADDPTWPAATFTGVRFAIFYIDTGTSTTSPLLSGVDFGADQSPAGADFVLQLDANGFLNLTTPTGS